MQVDGERRTTWLTTATWLASYQEVSTTPSKRPSVRMSRTFWRNATQPGPPHGRSGGAVCGDEALVPHTLGDGGLVSANTLPANPTQPASNSMSYVTTRTGMPLTFTSIRVAVDVYTAMALAAKIYMPKASFVSRLCKSQAAPCCVVTLSSEVTT